MADWHVPNSECAVCLAGAVMAKTLGAAPTEEMMPSNYKGALSDRLSALDTLRLGLCEIAFRTMDLPAKDGASFDRDIKFYGEDSRPFKRDMRKLATDLEEAGY